MTFPVGAIAAIARFELRRSWRALLVIGIVAGFVGAAVTGAVALARRTTTAHDRLEAAVHVEDGRVLLFGPPTLVDRVAALPGVAATWRASLAVAKLQGPGVVYVGVTSGPARPADRYTPIVVEGRAADPSAVDEAVVIESAANNIGVGVGDVLDMKMLLPEEVAQFDTGFGEPDGPEFRLEITGIVRVSRDLDGSPVLTTPAFQERFGDYSAGTSLFVWFEDRPGAREEFLAGAAEINDAAEQVPGAEEFDVLEVTDSSRNADQVTATSRVLVGGLVVFALVASIVGLIGVAQIAGRQQSTGAAQQRIEAALGLTAAERAMARALPVALAGAVAVAIAFAGGLAAGLLEPSGVMRRVEPHPGWAPNLAIVTAGALVTGALTVVIGAVAARRAGRAATRPVDEPSRVVRGARRLSGRPTIVAGLGFAFAGRQGRNPLRYSLPGVVVGIAGLVAALTFASSLDRLAATPSRYGWNGDFNVIDVNEDMVAELAADPRLDAVTYIESKSFVVNRVTLQAYSFTDVEGTTGWTIVDGRAPDQAGELVLTAQSARRIDVQLGDTVVALDAAGDPVELTVTGLGLGLNSSNERLDELALVHPDDMARLGTSQAFTEALVRAAPGQDVDAIIASYAERYELGFRTMPTDVANLVELGQLPEWLGAFLAVIAVVALVHLLAVTTARRARDLAVLRALGLTRGEVRRVVAVAAVSITAVGVLVGVPLGFAVGRLVWWSVAHTIGIATDASYELLPLVVLVPSVLVAAVLIAWWPARRATAPGVIAALSAE